MAQRGEASSRIGSSDPQGHLQRKLILAIEQHVVVPMANADYESSEVGSAIGERSFKFLNELISYA
jgi:hypothetical protein